MEAGGRAAVPFGGAPSVEGLNHILKEAQETGQINPSLDVKDVIRLDAVHNAFRQLQQREATSAEIIRAKEIYRVRDAV